MKRILFLFLSFFTLAATQVFEDDFANVIMDGYKSFQVLEVENNDDYNFCVMRGINKGRSSYAVYLYNTVENTYRIVVDDGSKSYEIEGNDRGDVCITAIEYTSDICVYLAKGSDAIIEVSVPKIDASYEYTLGLDKGCEFTKLKNGSGFVFDWDFALNVYVIALGLIGLACLVYVLKMSARPTPSVQFKQVNINSMDDLDEIIKSFENPDLHQKSSFEVDAEEVKTEKVYDSPKRSYDEIEEDDNARVKEILENKGFDTEYFVLSDDTKNTIMLTLMMLKDDGTISEDEYNFEVVQLWKK